MRLTGQEDAAWDVTQDTWIAIIKGIRRLKDPAAFATWAFRIIRNKSADYWRCDGYRQQLIAKSASQQRCDGQTNVSNRCDCLAEAIRRMPTERQELLALRYGENLSVIEIARILGVPPGTIKSRLYHAREELKRLIEGEEK